MPFNFAFKMLVKAFDEDGEKNLWEFYLKMVDRMEKDNFKSFEEWKAGLNQSKPKEKLKPMNTKSKNDLLDKVNKIKNIDQKR